MSVAPTGGRLSPRRWLIGGGLVFAAVLLHLVGKPFGLTLALWFALALAIGYVSGRWWAVLAAALPWPLGVGIGLAVGRYRYLGDGWQFALLLSVAVGAVGVILGWLMRMVTGPR